MGTPFHSLRNRAAGMISDAEQGTRNPVTTARGALHSTHLPPQTAGRSDALQAYIGKGLRAEQGGYVDMNTFVGRGESSLCGMRDDDQRCRAKHARYIQLALIYAHKQQAGVDALQA